jgi:O-acetylserine/cysteine efflux transporter
MTVRQVTGIAVAVLGMSLIFWHRSQVAAALPVVLTLLGGLGWAIGNVCSRQAQPESPLRLTMWMSVVPPLPMFAVSLLVEGPARDWHSLATINSPTGWSAIGALAYIVLPATILGSGLWTTLMRRNPAGVVAPFSLLVPVVGVGASWLLLHETPAWIELAAGVVVVFGVLLGIPKPAPKARRTPVLDEVVSAEV